MRMAARIRDSKPDSHTFEIEPGLLDPRHVVEALEKALPRDWEMVNSAATVHGFSRRCLRVHRRSSSPSASSRDRNGISFAMGVAAARPDSTVVLFDGDGSLMNACAGVETIKRHR